MINPRCERTGDREGLERRARFVVEPHGPVLERSFGGSAGIVGVEERPVRERQDRAAARIHHDRHGVFRGEHPSDSIEHVLRAPLNIRVKRQRQRGTGHLRMRVGDRHGLPERVADHTPLPGTTMQEGVTRVLEPRQPIPFGAHDAQHLRRQRAARIHAAHDGSTSDTGDRHSHDRLRLLGRQRPREIHEATVLAQIRQNRGLRLAQQRCQALRGAQRVLHQIRRRRDVLGGLGHGQIDAVAIGDRAALGGHGFIGQLLVASRPAQRP